MNGVKSVISTGDGKVEFICFENSTLCYVSSAIGYPAYYPLRKVELKKPVKAVLMDLDGTSVKSEEFWIWIIEKSIASLIGDENFKLEEADLSHVSGHSVSEHLQYCINKYCPDKNLQDARDWYFKHTHYEMNEIMEGRGKKGAFTPSGGLKELLLKLKERGIKIGLVTSGLYEKAWPEILSAFQTLEMGDERESCHVVGIEDSGAGVCSIKLAGYPSIGFAGGNIEKSGTKPLCDYFANSFEEIWNIIK